MEKNPSGENREWMEKAFPLFSDGPCPVCKRTPVRMRVWESSDGAYEDLNFWCPGCGHDWWIDGIDS